MKKRFPAKRFLKIGTILSVYFVTHCHLGLYGGTLWQISNGELVPFSSTTIQDSQDHSANDWDIQTPQPYQSADSQKNNENGVSIELGVSKQIFTLHNTEQPTHEAGHAIRDTSTDGKEWHTEVNDPSFTFYPGMVSNNFFTEEQLHGLTEEETRLLQQVLEETHEIAQAQPPAAPAQPTPFTPVELPPETQPLLNPIDTTKPELDIAASETPSKTILINFNNVNMIEFIRFVSRISNKNFVFDDNDLQFNVTIVSEEPTSIENIMMALIQTLRIHDLQLLEQGNNLVIHKNQKVNSISKVVMEDQPSSNTANTEIVTQVFHLNSLDPSRAADVVKPLISERAIVETLNNPNHIIITDIVTNVHEIAQLLKSLDAPKSGLVIGQYVVRNAFMDTLIQLAQKIMQPIAQEQTLTFVPHAGANSIFIISSPYLVERTISILQYLDQFQGATQILNPADLQPQGVEGLTPTAGATGTTGATGTASARLGRGGAAAQLPGRWDRDANGVWRYTPVLPPGTTINPASPPDGRWLVDENGNWYFQAGTPPSGTAGLQGPGGQPEGQWILTPQGIWVYQLNPGKTISAERLSRSAKAAQELPAGHIERTKFYIHKLRYRKGDQLEKTLGRIAKSFEQNSTTNTDLISVIHSVQWIESINSLVFSGTPASIEKMKELINEIDLPLRQVFIEMLILTANLQDSMELGVDWGSRFGGGQGGGLVAGSQAFLTGASTLPQGLDTAGLVGTTSSGITPVANGTNPISIADASSMARISGRYAMGLIGQSLHFNGTTFTTIGTLITALHDQTKIDIIMNPKIIAEDGTTAEIFVGENIQYPTQAVSNDRGSIVTQNFQYQDVGTRLKVTPYISSDDLITMDIEEEVSAVTQQATAIGNTSQIVGPTTAVSKSTMRVHVPNKYFIVISGLMNDTDTRARNNVPCLGGVPLIGGLFSDKQSRVEKQNNMIFIRPEIIDSEAQIDDLTKRQQNIWRVKAKKKKDWIFENQETLNWMNLKDTDWYSEDSSLE